MCVSRTSTLNHHKITIMDFVSVVYAVVLMFTLSFSLDILDHFPFAVYTRICMRIDLSEDERKKNPTPDNKTVK